MRTNGQTSWQRLLAAVRELRETKMALQFPGKLLTPGEVEKTKRTNEALVYIDKAIELLEHDMDIDLQPGGSKMKDGSYLGKGDDMRAELRIDLKESLAISMDLFATANKDTVYLASLRTMPGDILSDEQQSFRVICEDRSGKSTNGKLQIIPITEKEVEVELILENHLEMLWANTLYGFTARWSRKYFRKIGLETEMEAGVRDIIPYSQNGRQITVETCYEKAGIKLVRAGEKDRIPSTSDGWDDAQLHGLMTRFADVPVNKVHWMLHLLLLSRSTDPWLAGLMFDSFDTDDNGFPRQGAVVFMDHFQDLKKDKQKRSIQAVVHELGHTLNLVHRFDRLVRRADSTSFMNYDWHYKGGGKTEQYWKDFHFSFDPDEIAFMRHAPWWKVVPGGAEYFTAQYWKEGGGGYHHFAPEKEVTLFELQLDAPPTGRVFDFGVPVYLQITLKNPWDIEMKVPKCYLDLKAGFLEILITRITNAGGSDEQTRFRAILSRDYRLDNEGMVTLPPHKSFSNNINLTFGSAGFSFVEPGYYEVTALLSRYDEKYNYIIPSNTLSIRIRPPQNREAEKDALDFFSQDVGYYLALGGSDLLREAENKLSAIKEKRMHQSKTQAITDPLSAYITRAQAINWSRNFLLYEHGRFRTRPAKKDETRKLLKQLQPHADELFDPSTRESNQKLMETTEIKEKPENMDPERS